MAFTLFVLASFIAFVVSDGDELLGFRLYYGDAVMSCHLKIANIEKVVDTTYFCDVNNMVETTRCANDGMGDVAIEFENPTSYFDLNIESFYIGSSGDDMNLKFDAVTASYSAISSLFSMLHCDHCS